MRDGTDGGKDGAASSDGGAATGARVVPGGPVADVPRDAGTATVPSGAGSGSGWHSGMAGPFQDRAVPAVASMVVPSSVGGAASAAGGAEVTAVVPDARTGGGGGGAIAMEVSSTPVPFGGIRMAHYLQGQHQVSIDNASMMVDQTGATQLPVVAMSTPVPIGNTASVPVGRASMNTAVLPGSAGGQPAGGAARGAKRKRGEKGAAAARGKVTASEQQRVTAAAKKALEKRIAAYRRLRDNEKSCCTRSCLSAIPDEQAVQFITMVRGLEKDMQQMMMRALICTVGNTGTHFNVHLNGFGDLCRDAFAVVMGVHKDTITALRKSVSTPLAIEPPEHGLVGRRGNRSVGTNAASHMVATSVAAVARDFSCFVHAPGMLPVGRIQLDVQSGGVINQHIGSVIGFDLAGDQGDVDSLDLELFEPVCLPLGWSLTTLYRLYTAMCEIEGCQPMAVSSFHASLKDLWPNKVALQADATMYECPSCKARGEDLRVLTTENRMRPAKTLMNNIANGKYPLPPFELLAVPKATPLPNDERKDAREDARADADAAAKAGAKASSAKDKTLAAAKDVSMDAGSPMPLRFDAGEMFGEPSPSLASMTPSVSAASVAHRAVADVDELARTMATEQAIRCVNTTLAFHLAEADRLRSLQAAELVAARQSVGPLPPVPHLEYGFNSPFWLPQLRPRVEVAWARHVRSFSVLDANADEWHDSLFWDYMTAAGAQSAVSLLDDFIMREYSARVDVRHMRFRSPSTDDNRLVLLYHAFRVLNNEVEAVQHTFKLAGHDPSLVGIRSTKRIRQYMSQVVLTMDDFVRWWQTNDEKGVQRPKSTRVVDEEAFRQWHVALECFFTLPPATDGAVSYIVRRDAEHGVVIESYEYMAGLGRDALTAPVADPLPVGVSRFFPLKTQWRDADVRDRDAGWMAMSNRTVQALPPRGLTRPSWLAMHRLIEEKVSDELIRSKLLPPAAVLVTANEAHRRDALHAPELLTPTGAHRVELAIAAAKAAANMPKTSHIPTSTPLPIEHHHTIPPQSQMAPVSATNMAGAYVGGNGSSTGETAIPFSYMVQEQPTNRDVSVPDTFAPSRTDPSSSTVELPLNVTVHQSTTADGKQ